MKYVFINIFIMQKKKKKNAKIVTHYLYLSKLFTIVYNLLSLSLKTYWLFPTMQESHRKRVLDALYSFASV